MVLQRIRRRLAQLSELLRRVDDLQNAVGRIELLLREGRNDPARNLSDHEFTVYSQWGEDGIIQHLIRTVPIVHPYFVEFGVEDYKESNTRFLLQNNSWSGLVMDSSARNIESIKRDRLYYRHGLRAVAAFIDRDNINTLLTDNGARGDIGLLSIDIDGNDYWIWDAINGISPRIVICEYDSLLGCGREVVSPYDRTFNKPGAHYSYLYGGASLPALCRLGKQKGYGFVGSNGAGSNAFFVRNDVLGSLRTLTPREAYRPSQFRNSRDPQGNLTFLGIEESLKLIADMPLIDLETGARIRVRDLPPLSFPS